jgi:K+-transporting ATPase ATPase C chain
MKTNIFPAIKLTFVTLIFFSGIYTAAVWAVAQFAPNSGKGEIITANDKKYYTNIGQTFTADKYFSSRPSAVGYNAAGSGGSNKAPSNPDYLATVQSRIDTFLVHNPGINKTQIPVELVTASGSGLDPDISPRAAIVQTKRIAAVRKLPVKTVQDIVEANTEQPLLGLFGPEKINVLKLNLALDALN